ncbi:MAG: VIT1/CCC1 transporter family protein [Myxococcaceae bacterium]|nr:VIT1/CCC1 transporter family protein [Myxococcaceae bacterium]MCI0673640.1 VIT1/CCC1 transporter family protein [Myxococcaceae bacterium]
MVASGKPTGGFAHYLRDMVNGAVDGVITTLAVVSGATGASLDPRIGLILGMANLVADGLSMGASNYLALKSELAQTGTPIAVEKPWRHGVATSLAFAVVGALPLTAYAMPSPEGWTVFQRAILLAALALTLAGGIRARLLGRRMWRSAAEMLVIGMAAAGAAYAIGAAVERFTR